MSWEKIVTVGKNAFKDKYIFFKLLPFITFCIYIYIYIYILYLVCIIDHLSLREDKWVVERWGTISIIAISACTLFVLRYFHTLFCFRMVHRTFLRSFKGFLGPVPFLRVIPYLSLNSARLMSVSSFVHKSVLSVYYLSFHSLFLNEIFAILNLSIIFLTLSWLFSRLFVIITLSIFLAYL